MFTVEQLQACTESTAANAAKYHPHLVAAMRRFNITTTNQIAAFLATISVESARLSAVEENLNYRSADRLAAIFPSTFKTADMARPYVMNPRVLGKRLYDGYWGRGLIQLTWKANYSLASRAINVDYVTNPDLLTQPEHAALSACWFWVHNRCGAAADREDMKSVTRIVNGRAMLHLDERIRLFINAKKVLE